MPDAGWRPDERGNGSRDSLSLVTVYTDGACLGNPGPGGFAAILVFGEHRRELSGGYRRTTNNRMEIMAVIRALEALTRPCQVELFTDSQYVRDSIMKGWARGWRRRGWRKSNKDPALNADLWQTVLELCDHHTVNVSWVRGHSGHAENERCDELAVREASANPSHVDVGYESLDSKADRPSLF